MRAAYLIFLTFAVLSSVIFSQKACPAVDGVPGIPGIPGAHGRDGHKGKPGMKGEAGAHAFSEWKQCVWKKTDDRDHGLIQDCVFKKRQDDSSLRVFYSGTLSVRSCGNCCKRWFFTFNGAECSGPMPIDGLVYLESPSGQKSGQQPLRVRHIEGYCENITWGVVRVGFNVGNCGGYGNADAHTGWNSVSRIVIEEVPAPQK